MSLTNSIGTYSEMPLNAAREAVFKPSGIVTTAPLCIIQVITSTIALPIILALGLLEALSYNLFKIGDENSLSHIMPNLKSNLNSISDSIGGFFTLPVIAVGIMIASRKQPAAKIEPINILPPEEGSDWKVSLIGSLTPPPPLERLSPTMKNSLLMVSSPPPRFHEEKSDD